MERNQNSTFLVIQMILIMIVTMMAEAGLTMLGCKIYGNLYNRPLEVSSVDELLLGIEHQVALHEDAWTWRPQSWQHIRCTGICVSKPDPLSVLVIVALGTPSLHMSLETTEMDI